MHSLGKRIKALRIQLGISQAQLAEQAQLTPQYLHRIEEGMENPSLETLLRIAAGLKAEPAEILSTRCRGALDDDCADDAPLNHTLH